MVDVLVMANDSLLADLVMSSLARQTDLDVLRLTHHDSYKADDVLHEHCLAVIIIEEPESNNSLITGSDLLQDYSCLRIITISPEKKHLYICDRYQMPISGESQVTNLVNSFIRENRGEVKS